MPYHQYYKNGIYYAKNIRTGKITKFHSAESRENVLRVREAYSHGWKPKGLAAASPSTRRRVASIGGRSK